MDYSYYSDEDDEREWTDEENQQAYLEELEELGWDWDAYDPCTD